MTVQLPLPGVWPRNMSRRDPNEIELLLDRLAEKHGISHKVIAKAVGGYVDDMLGDVFFDLQDELERERDEAPEIC